MNRVGFEQKCRPAVPDWLGDFGRSPALPDGNPALFWGNSRTRKAPVGAVFAGRHLAQVETAGTPSYIGPACTVASNVDALNTRYF